MSTLTSVVDATSAQSLQGLALALTPGLGPTRARRLVEQFGSVEAVFRGSLTELESVELLAVSAQSIGTGKSLELAQEELGKAVAAGISMLSLDDPRYPARPREIYDPPLILYVRGSVEVLSHPGIAVVGTRHPTPYGSGMAERLAIDLSARGLVILSGMARGVDTAAHRGAIAAKAKTIAVFGTGVDEIYPQENTRLAEQILALGGALISEFPLGTFQAPQNFPIRNRIISGMPMGVLVVEAAEYSGTHITARCALEQNRDVFARARQRHQQEFLGAEYADQAGGPSWSPRGKTHGRNSQKTLDLRWERRPPMNPWGNKMHLYFRKRTILSVLTSARFSPCSRPTKPHTSTKSWSGWRRICRPPKFSRPCSNWSWRERCGRCRGRIL